MMAIFRDEEQNKKLAEIHSIQEENAIKLLAADFGVGYIDLSGVGINADALLLIPEPVARDARIACFAMVGKKISVAVQTPADLKTVEQIDVLERKGFEVAVFMVSRKSLDKAWARYADVSGVLRTQGGLLDISEASLQQLVDSVHSNQDIQELFTQMVESKETKKISRLMEIIFGSAIATQSSDVHIEAGEDHARLRFRQDGVLQDIVTFPLDIYKSLNSRIKLLSELKLTDTMLAQDGRFTIEFRGSAIEVRTSLIPGPYGESIVLRILNPEGLTVELAQLGIQKRLFDILEQQIRKPNGMILTTGPTGSGKTTTLYSFLKRVYTPEIKILTIEDPIEYHLSGITQTQVDHDAGYDFNSGLRAALRQDPDVIMVGEIRDKETAATAVNASLTGHLVLSTLHTNNAAGAIPRLIELGVSPKILPDALTVAMAQRLLRRLCPYCKKIHTPTGREEKIIRAVVQAGERTGKNFGEFGISSNGPIQMYVPTGCAECDNIGYKGRVGLYEAIIVDDTIARTIEQNPSEREIKNSALHQGIFTLAEDGMIKVLTGVTSLEELQGVVDLFEDLPEGFADQVITLPQDQKPVSPKLDVAPVMVNDSQNSEDNELYLMPYPESEQIKEPEKMSNDSLVLEYIQSLQNKQASEKPTAREPDSKSETVIPIIQKVSEKIPFPTKELSVLMDYVAMLEDHQRENPEEGIRQKLADAKDLIIELLKNNNPREWMVIDPAKAVHREVSVIIQQLDALEKHQSKKPNIGVAEELQKIRNTIQNLIAKE